MSVLMDDLVIPDDLPATDKYGVVSANDAMESSVYASGGYDGTNASSSGAGGSGWCDTSELSAYGGASSATASSHGVYFEEGYVHNLLFSPMLAVDDACSDGLSKSRTQHTNPEVTHW
jgi:EREBP-like factor